MLVSVIIPNYNHSLYLIQRIDSVLNQTFQDFELIILDDCSKDDSQKIIERYRHNPKVSQIIFNEQNSGSTFKQWEKGIEVSKGKIVWIAESDDWCESTMLQELVSPMLQDSSIVLSYCQSIVVSPERKILSKTNTSFLNEIVDGREFITKRMLGTNTVVNASMAVFKKSVFETIPDDYKSMRYCGDWFFWVNVCLQGKVHISGKYLNYYLRHENNVATTAIKMGYDFLEGNKIYHYIINTLDVSQEDSRHALWIKLRMYFEVKDKLLNHEIKDQVCKSMLELDIDIKSMIKKKIQVQYREKLIYSMKYYLKLVLGR